VINQIVASAKARDIPISIYYFRTRAGYEIDLILEMSGKTYAIEIKSGAVDAGDAHRLEHFLEYKKNISGLYLVCLSTPPKKIGKVRVCGLVQLIQELGL
jgi:predicted AAA+ superfamily ATPase